MNNPLRPRGPLGDRNTNGSRAFVQATLDWLPSHVAILDGDGEIIMTNGAWVQFAIDNGGSPMGSGENTSRSAMPRARTSGRSAPVRECATC